MQEFPGNILNPITSPHESRGGAYDDGRQETEPANDKSEVSSLEKLGTSIDSISHSAETVCFGAAGTLYSHFLFGRKGNHTKASVT